MSRSISAELPPNTPPAIAPLWEKQTTFPPRPVSFFYMLGMSLVAFTMILLPIIYVLLTVSAGYGVYYFATHHFLSIWQWPIGGKFGFILIAFCSIMPLLVGGAIVISMIKPLFAQRRTSMDPITLPAEQEPLFHALVAQICRLIGAPPPREIRIDCAVNASAGFRRGFKSLIENDLVLTVGLPLFAGLTSAQLAGVIAHEFGHFTQGAAMRLSYIIRRVNHWFARVIYERDAFDQQLEAWSRDEDGSPLLAMCCQAGVGIARLVLKALMIFGHAISSFLMRQMEFDADRCGTQVSGSERFETTALRLAELSFCSSKLYGEMNSMWRDTRSLPDNVPILMAHKVSGYSDKARASIETASLAEKTGLLDTHPSDADRIRAAQKAAEPGLFSEDLPAENLLTNYQNISRMVTLAHYAVDFGIPLTPENLIPVAAVLGLGGENAAPKSVPAPVRYENW